MTPIKYSALVEALGDLNSNGDENDSSNSSPKHEKLTTIDNIPGW